MNSQARVKIIDPYFRKDGARSGSRWEYAVEFPVNNRWLRSISDRKKISIRKFSVYPETNYVEVWAVLSDTDILIARAVWPTNGDVYSMLGTIEDQINTWLDTKVPGRSIMFYLSRSGVLAVKSTVDMEIHFTAGARSLMNQILYEDPVSGLFAIDPNDPYPPDFIDPTNGRFGYNLEEDKGIRTIFKNVWDRVILYMHASFSQASNNYVCEMDETFIHGMEKDFNYNAAQFDIWFSRDGKTPFKLHNDNFMFELQFTAKEKEFNR